MAFFQRKVALPEVPAGTRVYAIGDIHGRLDLLNDLLIQIEQDAKNAAPAKCLLVTLGDYVDRGPDSRGVIETLMTLSKDARFSGFEMVSLMGNHEDLMLAFFEDGMGGPMWLANGGDATLSSYGLSLPLDPENEINTLQSQFREALPADHLTFLLQMDRTFSQGDYMFVHAGIRPGVALTRQDPEDFIWIRDAFLKSKKDHGQVIVHGHSVTYEPEIFPDRPRPSRIGIDTGAYLTGCLTCLVLSGNQRRWLRTTPSDRFR